MEFGGFRLWRRPHQGGAARWYGSVEGDGWGGLR